MSDLKSEKFEVFYVDYKDFERLVKQVYEHNYDYIDDQEANNDSVQLFSDISGKVEKWDKKELKEFKKTGESPGYFAKTLLEDLCKQGHVKPGNYLIDVCW